MCVHSFVYGCVCLFRCIVCCDITAIFLPSDVQICHMAKTVMYTLFICLKPVTQCIFYAVSF